MSAADEIIGLYRRHARAWTIARGDRLIESDWLECFIGLMALSADVLDLGCGSGVPIARHLVGRGFAVTGIDSAPEMVGMFKANFPGEQAEVADMRSLKLGRRFGGVLAWDSFFHLSHRDQRHMFSVFREHAGPGSPLMFTSGPGLSEAIGTFEGEPLYHASLGAAEYRDLLDRYGFEVVVHVPEDVTCGGRTVWLARRGG